ncbi:TPA: hypothetical protein OMD89_004023 [Klebsiella oxytoca]|nr:hypothetical protein [Klebsiella oxytoca]HCQ8707765.1 hypothetical protein [Klebsiella oxytoca]
MNMFLKKLLNAVLPDPCPSNQDENGTPFLIETSSKSDDESPFALYSSENWHWHSDHE